MAAKTKKQNKKTVFGVGMKLLTEHYSFTDVSAAKPELKNGVFYWFTLNMEDKLQQLRKSEKTGIMTYTRYRLAESCTAFFFILLLLLSWRITVHV